MAETKTLETRIGEGFKAVAADVGNPANLETKAKVLVPAINEAATTATADKTSYTNYGKSTVAEALDELLYKDPQITNFKTNVSTQEMGATVTTVTLSWSVNKTPTALTLDDEALDVSATSKDLADQTITADKTFKLVMTDEKDKTATATTSILFRNGAYYGVSAVTADAEITKEFVAGLTKQLASSYKRDITVTAGEGEYIYYAFPTRFGASPRFFVGGFEGGFSKVKTFDYENSFGYTESYDVYRSTNANLGVTTVNVQ